MNGTDVLKFTYYNNLYNVHKITINNILKYGLPYATAMLGTPLDRPDPPISALKLLRDDHDSVSINCDKSDSEKIDFDILDNETKTQYKCYVKPDYGLIPNTKDYFYLSFNLVEEWNFDIETVLVPNYISCCLSNKDDLNFQDANSESFGYMDSGSLRISQYPGAPSIGYEQDTIWLAIGNYLVKTKSPFPGSTTNSTGQMIFDEYTPFENGDSIIMFGDKKNNKISISTWGDNGLNPGKTLDSPIDLNRDLYLYPGIAFKNTMYNTIVSVNIEFWDTSFTNPNDEEIWNWLDKIIIN